MWTFIDTCKFLYPSMTLHEAAESFMKRHDIDESQYSKDTVVALYQRINKDVIDAQRFQNKQKETKTPN